jgi:hypothetical protein
MSISANIAEIKSLKTEIAARSKELQTLRARQKRLEIAVADYIASTKQPGLRHKNTVITAETRNHRAYKKLAQRKQDALDILSQNGISADEDLINQIIESLKGDPVQKKGLSIKIYKD